MGLDEFVERNIQARVAITIMTRLVLHLYGLGFDLWDLALGESAAGFPQVVRVRSVAQAQGVRLVLSREQGLGGRLLREGRVARVCGRGQVLESRLHF